MTQLCKALHTKITFLYELETWANIGNIDNELGLCMVDISSEDFFIATLLDDTSITSCRLGSDLFKYCVMEPHQVGGYQFQGDFYSGYFCGLGLKAETLLLPNGVYRRASHIYNAIFVFNMSGLYDHLYDTMEECEGGRHMCALGDGIIQKVVTS